MKCLKCDREAVIQYPNGDVCQDCFLDILTNRIKKSTKSDNPFVKGEKVLVYGKLAEVFLKRISGGMPLNITETDEKYAANDFKEYDKVVIPWTADDEADMFYTQITKSNPNFSENSKIVKLFKNILDKELLQVSKILNISFSATTKNEEIEKIHKKYPSAKFGLVKSSEEFMKAIK